MNGVRAIAVALLFCTVGYGSSFAQHLNMPDEPNTTYSPESVNSVTGDFSFTTNDLSIGSQNEILAINFSRNYKSSWSSDLFSSPPMGAGFTHNYLMGLRFSNSESGFYADFILGNKYHRFNLHIDIYNVWHYSNALGDGAVAERVPDGAFFMTILTTADGTKYFFPENADNYVTEYIASAYTASSMVTKVEAPNGERLTFYYENTQVGPGNSRNVRLKGVRHSRGYGLLFSYVNNAIGGSYNISKQTVSKVQVVENICGTFPVGCDAADSKEVNYNYAFSYNRHVLSSVVDVDGNVTSYQFYPQDSESYQMPLKNITIPGYSSPYVELTYVDGYSTRKTVLTSSVKIADIIYRYDYCDQCRNGDLFPMTVTDPSGVRMIYKSLWLSPGEGMSGSVPMHSGPLSAMNALNAEIKYEYEWPVSRLKKITYPEGNAVTYKLDDRGNKTEIKHTARTGFIDADIVTKSHFPECTANNFRICNKPDYTIDARGYRTNYTWSEAHGGALTEARGFNSANVCALPGGVCPLTTFGYSAFAGADGAAFHLLTSKVEQIDTATTTTTTFGYDASNHFFPKEEVVNSGGQNLRTCFRYDRAGNLISKTLPRAGLATCP